MTKKFSAKGHSFPAAFGFKQSAGAVGVKGHLRAAPKRAAPAPAPMPAGPGGGYPALGAVNAIGAGLNKPAAAASRNAPTMDMPGGRAKGGAMPRDQRGPANNMAGFAKGGKVGCKY